MRENEEKRESQLSGSENEEHGSAAEEFHEILKKYLRVLTEHQLRRSGGSIKAVKDYIVALLSNLTESDDDNFYFDVKVISPNQTEVLLDEIMEEGGTDKIEFQISVWGKDPDGQKIAAQTMTLEVE